MAAHRQKPALYARIADALSVALVVALVGGATLGLTRYTDARDHRRTVEGRVGGAVDRLAKMAAALGPAAVIDPTLDAGLATVHVVTSGGTDEFGIAVGSQVAERLVEDARAMPEDTTIFDQDLLNRSAELDDYYEKHQPIPHDRRFTAAEIDDGVVVFAAFAPVVNEQGYLGLVRVSELVMTPPPSIPTSRFVLILLVAALLGFGASFRPWDRLGKVPMDRLALGAAAAIATGALFVGAGGADGAALVGWPALVAFVAGVVGGPGMAQVFRGVRERPGVYLYVAPAMIGMVVLVFVPFAMGIAFSFFADGDFKGFDNFSKILFPSATQHPNFYWTTGFTVLWTITNVVLHVGIGVALALVLNRPNLRFKGIYRMLLIVPWAVPNYITALIWRSMFNPQFGAINGLLDVVGIEPVSWLGPGSSFVSNYLACLTTNVWLGFPFMMVVTLGALQSIPKDLYEAADIDGAGRWQKFRQVTMPLLKPALVPAIILGVIWTFNMFNIIYLVSNGAPENETNILITEAYYAFKVLNQFGLAAAYSLLIFFMLLAYGWLQNRITRATEGAFE